MSDEPVDLWRNDGYTDYSHDVDEDDQGIAWVSGRGGVRGYATSGRHRDPYQNRVRRATPFDPVLVAGGGVAGTAQPVMLMHNSGRPTDGSVQGVRHQEGQRPRRHRGGLHDGRARRAARSSSPTSPTRGAASPRSTRRWRTPYRMKALDTFHPFIDTPETANPAAGCSAHYFEIEGPMLGAAWYGQGLRLIDISNARDVRQVGYYRVHRHRRRTNPSSNSWDMAFRTDRRKGDLVYLFDMSRGVEILRMKKGVNASRRMKAVTAPSVKRDPLAAKPVGALATNVGDAGVSYVCPLFT